MQRMLGNQRVAQLIQGKRLTPEGNIIGLQRKLTVGVADDQHGQEADRVACQVLSKPSAVAAASVQRAMSLKEDKEQKIQSKPLAALITPVMQRQMGNEAEKDKPVQLKSARSLANSMAGPLIQRDKIEHRALTWDDFQGKVPKKANYDAATFSSFKDPDLKAPIPNHGAVDTGEPCKVKGSSPPDSLSTSRSIQRRSRSNRSWIRTNRGISPGQPRSRIVGKGARRKFSQM